MKILPLVRSELARLTASKLGIASLVALMLVPIIYGGLYLWGNHDPYNNLRGVPAAIVVTDRGASIDGKTVNYGKDAAKTLLDGKKFGWHEVSASAAAAGVKSGKYDFSVTFPTSFSSDLVSAGGSTPTKAKLALTTNDTNGYLSTTLAKQATTAVQAAVTQRVAQAGSRTLLNDISTLRGGLVDALGGASKVASGAKTAASATAQLSNGLGALRSSTTTLPSSTTQLSRGAAQVAGGLVALRSGEAQYRVQLAAALAASGLPSETQAQLLAGFDRVASGTESASGGAAKVSAGASELAAKTPALASGIGRAASGASSLATGNAELANGASQLGDSLADGIAKVPATTASGRAATATALANPVVVQQHAITEAATYGAGLAPFFISLSAWIGIYALFLIVRPLSRRALTAVRRPVRTMLAGWITPAALGVVQMIALFAILTLALHLPVANGLGLLGFMAFISIAFAAIVLALNVLLGSVGQFLGLVLMIVQLVTAGGTFPWQTLPGPLRALHEALPMSHAVDGVRQLMYGGTASAFWDAFVPIAIWLVIGLAAATWGAARQGRFRTLTQLRPSAIGG
ncbi:MAG TPA: YhgE/Pip domain-containing protein [Galbitalea sp.]